jgi:hypothetical protein
MSTTYTNSITDTYTVARAKYVLGKVYEDLLGLYQANVIRKERCDSVRDDLLYLAEKKVLKYFQFQFKKPDGTEVGGLHYEVNSSGAVNTDDKTGGLDYWGLPTGTTFNLLVQLNNSADNYKEVNEELERRGWGTGSALSGSQQYLKSYSKDGYGYKQSKIGQW